MFPDATVGSLMMMRSKNGDAGNTKNVIFLRHETVQIVRSRTPSQNWWLFAKNGDALRRIRSVSFNGESRVAGQERVAPRFDNAAV
jgi:hypothetical protein